MFETEDGKPYVTAQWFYRARDTVSFSLYGLLLMVFSMDIHWISYHFPTIFISGH